MSTATPIRTLQHGEQPPEGEPRRYKNAQGYVRLRWRCPDRSLVECYEHRWVMGNPPADVHVHHINHVRDDNRPENLRVVTTTEHGVEHRVIDRARAVELYLDGLGTPEIARIMGHDSAAIYRAIRDEGVPMRGISEANRTYDLPAQELTWLYSEGASTLRLAELYGVSQCVILNRLVEWGVPRRRAGRSTAAQVARAEAAIREVVGR